MSNNITDVKSQFSIGISRIAQFWGLPKAFGAIYAAVYLSPKPINLDELVKETAISKGAVSTNIRHLERLGMVHKEIILGDRKDYYIAEDDFWVIVKGILREREKNEFDHALKTVDQCMNNLNDCDKSDKDFAFYNDRLSKIQKFFKLIDKIVAAVLALDELRFSSLSKVFTQKNKNEEH